MTGTIPGTPDETQLATSSAVPWRTDLPIGSGFDVVTRDPRRSALASATVVHTTDGSEGSSTRFVKSDADFEQEVKAAVSASGVVEGVTVKGHAEFLDKIRFSTTSSTLLLTWTKTFALDTLPAPTLSTEAKGFVATPADFRRRYGDYCVTGGIRRAQFTAVYVCQASSSDSLVKFEADVAATIPDVGSAEASVGFQQKASSHGITLNISVSMSTHSGNPPADPKAQKPEDLTPAGVIQVLEWFKANASGDYFEAELEHYSLIDGDLTPAIPVPPTFFGKLEHLDVAVANVRRLSESLPRVHRDAFQTQVTEFLGTVDHARGAFIQNPAYLDELSANAADLENAMTPLSEFYTSVTALSHPDGGSSRVLSRTGGSWGVGRAGNGTVVPSDVPVHKTTLTCEHKYQVPGNMTAAVEWSEPGARIIALDVVPNWTDDTDGAAQTFQGGIGSPTVRVGFEGDYDRGLSWHVNVDYVLCD